MKMMDLKSRFLRLIVVAIAVVGLPASAYAAVPYPASNVLGQPNFTTVTPGSTQTTQKNPDGVAIDNVHNRLFVSDYSNNRVLVYNSTTITNGQAASYVIGQPDFTTVTGTTTQNGLKLPGHIYYDPGSDRLFVADAGNNRILVFNTATVSNGMNAVNVIGQANFNSSTAAVTQAGINGAAGVVYDPVTKRLFVADTDANRVLIYDATTITNGMAATNVLGQVGFVTAIQPIPTTAHNMRRPLGVSYDGVHNRLFVAEFNNNRVSVFDTSAVTNGMDAAYVLGQADFIGGTGATTQSRMNAPSDVAYEPLSNRLFVTEFNNMRVTYFNLDSIATGMDASAVLGQPDFTTAACVATQFGMCGSNGVTYDPVHHLLFEGDLYFHRTLIFNFVDLIDTVSAGRVGENYQLSLGTYAQGTTTYTVSSGSLPPGISLNTSTGQLSGKPTQAGSYSFSISVSDDNGIAGVYTDSMAYTMVIDPALPGLPKTGGLPILLALLPLALLAIGTTLALGGSWTLRNRFNRR